MRYIALHEFQPGLVADIMPPSSYLEKTNGTLAQEQCRTIIDENGFMVSEKACRDKDNKILLLGNSSIENLYIPSHHRILSRLEDMAVKCGKRAKVYNAGISNTHLLHIVNLLINKGIGLRPKIVIFYLPIGQDMLANKLENSFWNSDNAITTVRKAGQDGKGGASPQVHNRNNFEDERRLLRLLCDICSNFGMKLFIATWPIYGEYDGFMEKYSLNNRPSFEEQQAETIILNEIVRNICREKSCELIDLEKTFADLDHHHYFYDWNHPNINGCELIASVTSIALSPYL